MRPCRPDVPLKLLLWKGSAGGVEPGRMGPISERDHRTPDLDAGECRRTPSFRHLSRHVKGISIKYTIIVILMSGRCSPIVDLSERRRIRLADAVRGSRSSWATERLLCAGCSTAGHTVP